VHPAKSNESPFTTPQKILVHLERHFHSNLSLQASIQLHISTAFLCFSTLYIGVHSAHTSSFLLFTTMFLFQFIPYTLYTSLFSAGVGAGWHPGDPENHIPMIHLPLTRTRSPFLIYPFSWLALLFVPSLERVRSPSRARGSAL
jgi:hypothetical protein